MADYIGAASADEIVFTRGTPKASIWSRKPGVENFSGAATSFCSPKWNTTAISCRGNCSPNGPGRGFVSCPCAMTALSLSTDSTNLLTPEVKLFAFTHISNSLGTINPVAELCRKAREVGAITVVDAAQSAGHMPINVQEIGCDFLAFSGHKMCGPTGIGVLYGRAEVLGSLPPWQGGGEMIVSVTLEKSSFKKPPHRFEAGTPNIAGAIGLAAAIDYIEKIGRAAIFEHDSELTRYALERFRRIARNTSARPIRRAWRHRWFCDGRGASRTISRHLPTNTASPCAAATIAISRSCAGFGLPARRAPAFIFTTRTTKSIG